MFYSLEDLNAGIRKQLEFSNHRPLKGKAGTRRDLFEVDEKPLLKTLPATGYEIKHVTESKVQRNYHVILGEDRHQYSVPHTLIGRRPKIIYTTETVEIYDGLKRVVIHKRNYEKMDYTTLPEHMPTHHQHVHQQRGWDGNYFKDQALCVGPATLKVIERILTSRSFYEQTYTSCLGVLRLGKKYGNDRLEAACLRSASSPLVNLDCQSQSSSCSDTARTFTRHDEYPTPCFFSPAQVRQHGVLNRRPILQNPPILKS